MARRQVVVLDKRGAERGAAMALFDGAEGFGSASEAFARIKAGGVDAVVIALGTEGDAELGFALEQDPTTRNVPVVALASRDSLYDEIASMNIKADAYLPRARLAELPALVGRLPQPANPARDLYRDFVVGQGEDMQRLLALVAKVAPTDMNVLIEGESGSGKDLLARVVHSASTLAASPFVAVNCAAIPVSLLDSEFFGHVKGAFTDAKTDRAGFFQAADGGTLFLDEIGELPLDFQAKLLRACESGEIRQVGASASKHVKVRIISATNRTLTAEVEAGRFRQDLFFRLHQFGLRMPSLNERREDLRALVTFFLRDKCAALNPAVTDIEPAVLDVLMGYRFPGNLRELRNLLQSLKVVAEPPLIRLQDLPRYIRSGTVVAPARVVAEPDRRQSDELTLTINLGSGLKEVMADVMAKVLRGYVALAGGVIKDAAVLAGVPLPTWYRKVREADLTQEIPSGD